jgi:ADP-ribose pyrophosphatase YjhB (NUDIX family)
MPITPIDDNLTYVFVVAGSVIKKDGKYLLVQEKQSHVYGLWNLPAGKAEKNFSIAENAIKEVKEETGFDVEIIREIDIYHKDGEKSVKHAFEAKITGGELKFPKDEILDAKWFSLEEIEELDKQGKIRSDWVVKAIDSVAKSV